jgi:hypothetical protein
MWIANNLWEEREDGQVHYLPGLHPLDIDEGIVEQAKFMGIHIIQKDKLKNVSARLSKWAVLIKVHQRGNAGTHLTDEQPGEFQKMLTEFQGLFGKPTFANSQNGGHDNFSAKSDPNGKILYLSPYHPSPRKEAELQGQIDEAVCCSCIQPSRSTFGSPVCCLPKIDGMLRMCIDYTAVNSITVKDRYSLPHIEDIFHSTNGFCLIRKLDLAAGSQQIRVATATR